MTALMCPTFLFEGKKNKNRAKHAEYGKKQ